MLEKGEGVRLYRHCFASGTSSASERSKIQREVKKGEFRRRELTDCFRANRFSPLIAIARNSAIGPPSKLGWHVPRHVGERCLSFRGFSSPEVGRSGLLASFDQRTRDRPHPERPGRTEKRSPKQATEFFLHKTQSTTYNGDPSNHGSPIRPPPIECRSCRIRFDPLSFARSGYSQRFCSLTASPHLPSISSCRTIALTVMMEKAVRADSIWRVSART